MLLQTLVLVASMAVVTAALLTDGLFAAKAALRERLTAASRIETGDATARFVSWARAAVAADGVDPGGWPKAAPIRVALCDAASADGAPCTLYATLAWTVDGSTLADDAAGSSTARNLSAIVEEQRVSATLSVTLTDAAGARAYAASSREITLRVFAASPYAIVTATRDVAATAGASGTFEGDSAGFEASPAPSDAASAQPAASDPAAYTDTAIGVAVDCSQPAGTSETLASSDGTRELVALRRGGDLAYAFRVPCSPAFAIVGAPAEYRAAHGSQYDEPSSLDRAWRKRVRDASAFAP